MTTALASNLALWVPIAVASATAAGLTALYSRWHYRQRVAELRAKLKVQDQRQTTLLTKQAGLAGQVDALRAEVRQHKEVAAALSSKLVQEKKHPSQSDDIKAMNELFIAPRIVKRTGDFEDTQIL